MFKPRNATFGASFFAFCLLLTQRADAHVKWFCQYDLCHPPAPLREVALGAFGPLFALTLAVLAVAAIMQDSVIGNVFQRGLDRLTAPIAEHGEWLMRVGLGVFFVTLWRMHSFVLTPETIIWSKFIPWVQLGIAACLVHRRTMVISAAGIAFLYGFAAAEFGLFHMLDYPIFLAAALYLAVRSLGIQFGTLRPIDILRIGGGITLMWASVEKWAYPEWTYPLLMANPDMTMGYSVEFYMKAAGMVEFALAFALVCGPLMWRVASIILTAMFVGAIFKFGMIDAIGHSPIIVVLLLIIADRGGERAPARRWEPLMLIRYPAWFAGAVAATVACYYGGHALLMSGAPV